MSFILLTHLSNFVSIKYYLLYDPQTYFLCIILHYEKFQFKQLTDDIIIVLWYSRNLASIEWSCSFTQQQILQPNFLLCVHLDSAFFVESRAAFSLFFFPHFTHSMGQLAL